MKTLNLFSFLFLIIFFTGCKAILMKMYGVKKPEIENAKSVIDYAIKIGLDTSNIVAIRNVDDFGKFYKRGLPEGIIFDSSGDYIEYKQSDTSCNAGLFPFIKSLKKNESYRKSDEFNLKNELNLLSTLQGQPLKPLYNDYDFLFLIFWVKWEGKLNKDHVLVWQNLAANNNNAKIKTILVNLDVQEYWETEKRDELLYSLRKAIN